MVDILDLFSRKDEWHMGFICSFDIEPLSFFENEILCKLKVSQNLTVAIDERNRKNLLYQDEQQHRYLGTYYNLEGVSIRNGGSFHPKFYLFVNDEKANIALGSFNLTEKSYKRNLETVIRLSFELNELDQEEACFLGEIKDFLKGAFVDENGIVEYVSPVLREAVVNIIKSPIFLSLEKFGVPKKRSFRFLSSERLPLMKQVLSVMGRKPGIRRIDAMSPFYDEDASAICQLKKSTDKLNLFVPVKKSTFPVEPFKKEKLSGVSVYAGERIENEISRFIHAKRYRFNQKSSQLDLITSANLTMPGLFNDGAKCRNLEIGILMPAEGGKFPGIDAFNLDNSLASIDTRKDDTPSTKNHIVDENIAIESACFDGKDVIFNYRKAVADKFKNLQSKLKVGELEYETLKPLEEDGFYKIRPSVEIEGDQCIILKLVSKNPEWESYPYFVSRKVHTPNLLPALGDSAFQRCLREGGTEGLDMAFRLAEESGREDWLLYLLYCWDLAKILAGQEAGDPPPEGFDPLPNVIPRKKTDYSEKRFSQNVDLVLDDTDRALEKLKKFFDELFESKNAIIGNFIEYALPLVLEISWKFHKIICEQEANQKAKWDNGYIWVWPKFTLFFNIQKYERYFSFFVESFLRANELSKNTNQDSCLLTAIILVWYRKMHTQKTLAEKGLDSSKQIYGQFMAMPEEELLTIMQLVKDSPDCREKLNELFSKYKIEPLECME